MSQNKNTTEEVNTVTSITVDDNQYQEWLDEWISELPDSAETAHETATEWFASFDDMFEEELEEVLMSDPPPAFAKEIENMRVTSFLMSALR